MCACPNTLKQILYYCTACRCKDQCKINANKCNDSIVVAQSDTKPADIFTYWAESGQTEALSNLIDFNKEVKYLLTSLAEDH